MIMNDKKAYGLLSFGLAVVRMKPDRPVLPDTSRKKWQKNKHPFTAPVDNRTQPCTGSPVRYVSPGMTALELQGRISRTTHAAAPVAAFTQGKALAFKKDYVNVLPRSSGGQSHHLKSHACRM